MFQKINQLYKKLGPAFITLEADNDAGAVASYTQAGATYGFGFFWLIFLLLPITYFCQEAVARLAISTQRGPITLIKEKFGVMWAKVALFNLLLINFLTLITEFAAINQISQTFHLNPYITVPLSIIGLCLLVSPFNYNKWERIMVGLCIFDLSWLILALLVPYHGFVFNPTYGIHAHNYLFDLMAIIGTTIAPWQLFFQHSCILDKKMKLDDLKDEQSETFIGSVFTIMVAACMMIIGAIAYFNHIPFTDVPHFAQLIYNTTGPFFANALFLLVVNASIIGTAGVSLSTAWAYAEDKGWSKSLNKKFSEAKQFYLQYFGTIIAAGLVTLYPQLPLEKVIVGVQVIACVFLPYQLILIQLMCNDKDLMGDNKNQPWNNLIMNTIIGLIIVLSAFLFKQTFVQ